MRSRLAVATIVTSACIACGPGKNTTTESEPTTTLEPTSTSPTDGVTTTSTTAPTGTSPTETSTGEPQACDAFLPDEILGDQTTITITNAGAVPLWIEAASCIGLPKLVITDAEGDNHFFAGGPCSPPPCESLMQGECLLGCDDCGVPPGLKLEPGASFSVLWAAADVEFMEMTAECAPEVGCAGPCAVARERPAGTYDVAVTAFQTCVGSCDCDPPNPGGHCTLEGGIVLSEPLTVSLPLAFPEMPEIEVSIGAL
ncbi:hypothetical protein [Nannocystis punicea]|uniref:Thaumatin family protein n=1 Tax=Nannocystis punicea TaxID=2995304 RepID=A0ABY7H560_9BACT|nr:hypothetical protein [Nannocystis poenicansa]WAS94210.1 hypothetical protein O0S08_49440 [Nannocystis poenicansa]